MTARKYSIGTAADGLASLVRTITRNRTAGDNPIADLCLAVCDTMRTMIPAAILLTTMVTFCGLAAIMAISVLTAQDWGPSGAAYLAISLVLCILVTVDSARLTTQMITHQKRLVPMIRREIDTATSSRAPCALSQPERLQRMTTLTRRSAISMGVRLAIFTLIAGIEPSASHLLAASAISNITGQGALLGIETSITLVASLSRHLLDAPTAAA